MIVSVRFFSAIASNAVKIHKLSNQHEAIIKNTEAINVIGHSTIALGNGLAGNAILGAFSMFIAFVLISSSSVKALMNIDIFMLTGLVIGVVIPFIFLGSIVIGLKKTVLYSIKEMTRQIKDIPFLLENKARPDIIHASDLSTCIAMNALILPGVIMLLIPITLSAFFGLKMLLGLGLGVLLGSLGHGFQMCNMGDVLHHSKYYIRQGYCGGLQSKGYQNISIADSFGDTQKDLLGPSLNILIKSVTIVSLLLLLFLNN